MELGNVMIEPEKRLFTEQDGIMRPGGFGLTDRMLQLCAFKPGDRVADIGCGFGATVEYLRQSYGIDALGIDPSASSLAQGLRRNLFLPLSTASAEDLPFESGTLDGILAECSLSVIANKEQALAECCRALRPGGTLAVTDVYARNTEALDTVRGIPLPFGITGIMTQDTMTAMVRRHGFSLTTWEDHSQVLKQFLFQAIMEEDSSPSGTSCLGQDKTSCQESLTLLKRLSLGYFILVASKEGTGTWTT
jgi:ubiquinone/menaquinone biosynthesis C-methylase UbiE